MIEKYIKLPKYYWEKLEQGTFNLTHFSDILRVELLAQYDGIWMDATIVLNDVLLKEMYDLQLFSIKHKKYSDWHICKILWTGFFIAFSKENEMMLFMRDLFREYWSKENVFYLDDYSNNVYSEINFKESMGNTSISKLHYKRSFFKVSNKGQLTNYGYISKLVE